MIGMDFISFIILLVISIVVLGFYISSLSFTLDQDGGHMLPKSSSDGSGHG